MALILKGHFFSKKNKKEVVKNFRNEKKGYFSTVTLSMLV
jgi:hypothetical protein